MKKRLLLVEDQTLVRKSLVALINTSEKYHVSDSVESVASAIALLKQDADFDLILCDYSLKGETALDFLQEKKGISSVPVILLTSFFNARYLQDCINFGAKGFLFKECDADELEEAFGVVLSGSTFFKIVESNQELQKSVLTGGGGIGLNSDLTPKEHEILRWMATGMSNKEIAKVLMKSDQTVKAQARELMRKLEVGSRTEAVIKATQLNII
ncbi:MAG: response regulator transcription factor [Oleispira sp.]|nr:response regulator transcription factor [Oleispira sp.]MBL4881375.1 response regulator transcription factor [Oleispira sp.]